jgi:hypothetical protein
MTPLYHSSLQLYITHRRSWVPGPARALSLAPSAARSRERASPRCVRRAAWRALGGSRVFINICSTAAARRLADLRRRAARRRSEHAARSLPATPHPRPPGGGRGWGVRGGPAHSRARAVHGEKQEKRSRPGSALATACQAEGPRRRRATQQQKPGPWAPRGRRPMTGPPPPPPPLTAPPPPSPRPRQADRSKDQLFFASEASLSYLDGTLPGDFGFDPLGLVHGAQGEGAPGGGGGWQRRAPRKRRPPGARRWRAPDRPCTNASRAARRRLPPPLPHSLTRSTRAGSSPRSGCSTQRSSTAGGHPPGGGGRGRGGGIFVVFVVVGGGGGAGARSEPRRHAPKTPEPPPALHPPQLGDAGRSGHHRAGDPGRGRPHPRVDE